MKQQFSDTFNKEKLVFLGAAAMLSVCVYHFISSRPIALEVGIPVSPLPVPAPLNPEKPDPTKGDVRLYLERHQLPDGTIVSRDRNNPFAPITELQNLETITAKTATGGKVPDKVAAVPPPPKPPDPPEPPEKKKPEEDRDKFGPKDLRAQVDFSGVMSMGGVVYGLLKDKDGKNFQVKAGDYIEDFKYTVSRIDKQAIWVTDENDRQFVARDMTFAGEAKGDDEGDGDKPKKKKDKPAKGGEKGGPPGGKKPGAAKGDKAAMLDAATKLLDNASRKPGKGGE